MQDLVSNKVAQRIRARWTNLSGSDSRQIDEIMTIIAAWAKTGQLWKMLTKYGRRSLVEMLFSRLKTRFAARVQNRSFARLQVELRVELQCLNYEIGLSKQVKN